MTISLSADIIDGWNHIHLDDNGVGFPDDLAGVRQDGISDAGSTGLGLTTIELAINCIGGRLELGSAPRGGARVTLVLRAA